jgi:hypothetical protein
MVVSDGARPATIGMISASGQTSFTRTTKIATKMASALSPDFP